MADVFQIKKDDTLPLFEAFLKEEDGTAINLTNCDVKLLIGNFLEVDVQIIGAPADGRILYEWLPGDTSPAGIWPAEVRIEFPTGKIRRLPTDGYFTIHIVRELVIV